MRRLIPGGARSRAACRRLRLYEAFRRLPATPSTFNVWSATAAPPWPPSPLDPTTLRRRVREGDPPEAKARLEVLEAQDGPETLASPGRGREEAAPDQPPASGARTRHPARPAHFEIHRHHGPGSRPAARAGEGEPAPPLDRGEPGSRELELAPAAAHVAEGDLKPACVHAHGERDAVLAPGPARLPPQDSHRFRQPRPLTRGVEVIAQAALAARSAASAAGDTARRLAGLPQRLPDQPQGQRRPY